MNTAEDSSNIIDLEIRINARPETVFPYLIDPDRMVMWMGVAPPALARTRINWEALHCNARGSIPGPYRCTGTIPARRKRPTFLPISSLGSSSISTALVVMGRWSPVVLMPLMIARGGSQQERRSWNCSDGC